MAKPPKSALGRLASLGGLTGRVTSSYVGQRIAGVFQDTETRQRALDRMHIQNAERVVETVGRLKGAAMKVGQSLAMVAGNLELPEEIRGVLGRLHDKAEPVPFEQIQEDIERSLGKTLGEAYGWFDPQPLGTASLGQAHAARTHAGEEVVVKVLHRGIEASVSSDLAALRAMLIGGRLLRRDKAEIDGMFDEIRARLEEELDYLQEAANVAEFGRLFENDPDVRIPSVHLELSTARVLTLDRLPGLPLERFLETATPETRQRAGLALSNLFYRMVYLNMTLHADPHPGNYLFEPDGRIGLLDFGCVRRYDAFWIGHYAQAALAAIANDRRTCMDCCRAIDAIDEDAPPEAEDALWNFCFLITRPYQMGAYELGGEEDDRLSKEIPLAVARLLQYPQIHSTRELLFMHRTLGGIYALQRRLRPKAVWRTMLEPRARIAVARSQSV